LFVECGEEHSSTAKPPHSRRQRRVRTTQDAPCGAGASPVARAPSVWRRHWGWRSAGATCRRCCNRAGRASSRDVAAGVPASAPRLAPAVHTYQHHPSPPKSHARGERRRRVRLTTRTTEEATREFGHRADDDERWRHSKPAFEDKRLSLRRLSTSLRKGLGLRVRKRT